MRSRVAPALLAASLVTACSSVPSDPDGTLERVESTQVLRAAASPREGQVSVDGSRVSGPEPELVEGFAEKLGAKVEWQVMGEEPAVEAMERGEIDLLVGGMTDQSPYAQRVGMTRPYTESVDHGETVKHVMAVPMGENAMLSELERYLDEVA